MTRSSPDIVEALEHLSMFTDSGYYGLPNVQVRAICSVLRASQPAAPTGGECPLCPGFSDPCGNSNCPQLATPTAMAQSSEGERSARDYEHGYNDGVEWATVHGRSSAGIASPINQVCDLQALLEIRDFLRDIVGGAEITERSRDAATGFVSIMDSQFGAAWSGHPAQGQQDQALRELVEFWIYDGRLQTFEDRERFRKAARAALAMTSTEGKPSMVLGTGSTTGSATIREVAITITSPNREASK